MIDTMVSHLSTDSVHVWSISLRQADARAPGLLHLLSTDEKQRAERFHNPRDGARFVVRRAVRRILLGHYLQLDTQDVWFESGTYGKPRVAAELNPGGLEFSCAHSDRVALCAFTLARAVGIDVERIHPLPDMKEVARTILSPGEQAALFALPKAEQCSAFYLCWTRKEAYLKATGEGLSTDLSRVEVSLAPGEPARLLRVEGSASQAARWSLQSLQPAAGYAGALAVQGHDWHLVQRQWAWEAGPQTDYSSPT